MGYTVYSNIKGWLGYGVHLKGRQYGAFYKYN